MRAPNESPDQSIVGALGRWWRSLVENRAGRVELNTISKEDLGRVARDLGVNTEELRALAGKWPDSADLLARRMAALNLEPEEIKRVQPSVSADLKKSCSLCASKRRCEHDLAKSPESPVWQEYCPNATTLSALKAERTRKSKGW